MPTNLLVTSWEHFCGFVCLACACISSFVPFGSCVALAEVWTGVLGSCVLAGRIRKWFEWPALVQCGLVDIWFQFSSVCYCDRQAHLLFHWRVMEYYSLRHFQEILTFNIQIRNQKSLAYSLYWSLRDSLYPVSYPQPWGKEGLLPNAWNFLVDSREFSHRVCGNFGVPCF